jgi:hypothetical protein
MFLDMLSKIVCAAGLNKTRLIVKIKHDPRKPVVDSYSLKG